MIGLRTLAAVAALVALPAAAQFPLPIDTTRNFDAGFDHNLAALPNGQLWAWGGNAGGKLGNGTTVDSSVPVRVGASVPAFASATIVAVAASQANSYAIDSTGTAWAWGDSVHQGFGSRLGTTAPHTCIDDFNVSNPCAKTPVKVPIPGTPAVGGIKKIVQIGAGWGHAVALRDDGTMWAWGDNSNGGQLGQGNQTGGAGTPVQVVTASPIVQIAVGYFHTLALASNGAVIAWGRNDEGQIGVGNTTNQPTPVAVPSFGTVTQIKTRGRTSFALTNLSHLWVWGAGQFGQAGTGPGSGGLGHELSPVTVKQSAGGANVSNIVRFWVGYVTNFVLLSNNKVYAWGKDDQADPQLGIPPGANACNASVACVRFPTQIPAEYDGALDIVAGGAHTIVRKADNTLKLFGNNASGQLMSNSVAVGGGTFGSAFSNGNVDPGMTPSPLAGTGSSVGAASRVGGLSFLTLGAGIDFGNRTVSTPSSQLVTFENLESSAMSISAPTAGGDFAIANNTCNSSVAANASCTFDVVFTPSSTGAKESTVTIPVPEAIAFTVVGIGVSVPGAPTNVIASAGNASATVTFSPPASDGGTAITGYTVVSNPGGGVDTNAGSTPTTHTITGLTNGTSYTFTVVATNSVGNSTPSQPSNSVTPLAGFTLTVSKNGTGTGTVTSNPAGVDCGATCAFFFTANTPVTLTATPTAGSTSTGWSGSGCSGTATCQVTMSAARAVTATFDSAAGGRLFNISTRMQVLTGNDVMIAGFIVGGSTAKTVVINVAGPHLANFGISNFLANPMLTLVRSSDNFVIDANDDWQSQAPAKVAALQASGFQPNNAAEPAVIATLAPGAYTAIVQGVGNTTGVGLVGAFEVDHPEVPVINISTRGQVLTNNDVMIAGFIIQGSGPKTVVVNVAGPHLANFGINNFLANPTLTLVRSSDNAVLATNDDWQTQTNPADVAAIQATGFQPNNAFEPAIIATLVPGAYTAIVSGVGGTTGVGLVGVFAVP